MTFTNQFTINPSWTPVLIERLKEERARGLSSAQIAKLLNREFRTTFSRNAVIGKAARLGLTQPALTTPSKPARVEKPITPPKPRALKPVPAPKPAPPPRPEPVAPADLTVIPATAKHWIERAPCQCAWPVAGQGYETLSCCAPTREGSAYCAPHYAAMHMPPKPGMTAQTLIRSVRRYL